MIYISRNLNPHSSKRCLSPMGMISVRCPGASARIPASTVKSAARRNAATFLNISAVSVLPSSARWFNGGPDRPSAEQGTLSAPPEGLDGGILQRDLPLSSWLGGEPRSLRSDSCHHRLCAPGPG